MALENINAGRIERIDALRGIAIIGVFLFHCQISLFSNCQIDNYYGNNIIAIKSTKEAILNFSPTIFGWSCVELFLLISGFLIHLAYLSNASKFSTAKFYSKRFWRIYPPYFLILIFFCFARNGRQYLSQRDSFLDFFSHLLLVHNLNDKTIYSINASFWSLALEMQLYFVYPLLLFVRRRIGMNRTFILSFILSLLVLIVGVFKGINSYSYDFSVIKLWFVWCAGALLAENHFNNKKIFTTTLVPIILVVGVLTILSKIFLYSHYLTVYLATLTWLAFFEWFLQTGSIRINSFIFRIVSKIGICSYSIYLVHQAFLPDLLSYFVTFKKLPSYFLLLKIIPVFAIIFLVSYSLYLFVEIPSIKLGNYLRNKTYAAKVKITDA